MMSVRELQILGEKRKEKDRMSCRESLLAFGLGKNVITVQLHSYIRCAFALKHKTPRRRRSTTAAASPPKNELCTDSLVESHRSSTPSVTNNASIGRYYRE